MAGLKVGPARGVARQLLRPISSNAGHPLKTHLISLPGGVLPMALWASLILVSIHPHAIHMLLVVSLTTAGWACILLIISCPRLVTALRRHKLCWPVSWCMAQNMWHGAGLR